MDLKATYAVTSWDEKPVMELDDGSKMTRASVTGTYEGDLEGEGRWESVMWYRPDGSASYTLIEHIDGRIGERAGSFVVRARGTFDGKEARSSLVVVPGSATGGLEGMTGEGTLVAPLGPKGTVELEVELS
jgi:hypothetical protein